MAPQNTYASILTPAGRGAIATIAVRGPRAVDLIAARFVSASGGLPTAGLAGRILFGNFRSLVSEEELIVVVVGPQEVDIHCHGGPAAANAIVDALVSDGACRQHWTDLAAQESQDPVVAEARIALASAQTERTCGILLDQFRGALSRELVLIEGLIAGGKLPEAEVRLDRLEALMAIGLHLTEPWKVVLSGAPNVGKSSLINALLGYQRSIVFDQPGTTRDVLTAATAIDGWPVELSDTAGLRPAGDALEAAGVARARVQLAKADCVLLVVDVSADRGDQLLAAAAWLPKKTLSILVGNKCDLISPEACLRWQHAANGGVLTSAKTGAGIAELCAAINQRLVQEPPLTGQAVPFLRRHRELLAALRQRMGPDPKANA